MKDRIQFAFGAELVEVRVHARTREIRDPRVVSAFAADRIVDPLTAKGQLIYGMIWGVPSLHVATEIDQARARYTDTDLATYPIPMNADIGVAEVILISEHNSAINEVGVKGVGVSGKVGTNAVDHATGVRVREMSIGLGHLLNAPLVDL